MTCHDMALCHLLQPKCVHKPQHNTYSTPLHVLTMHTHTQDVTITINSYTVLGRYGALVCGIQCTHITHKQYCQMYVCARRVPANRNTKDM
jgi:hypothetical protein